MHSTQGNYDGGICGLRIGPGGRRGILGASCATVVNNSDFFGAGVNETSFIGSRVIDSPPPIVTDDSDKSLDEDNSTVDVPVTVGSTLAVAAVICAFLLYLVVARRRARPRRDAEAPVSAHDATSKQVPTGGADDVSYHHTQPPPPKGNSSNLTPRSIGSASDLTDDARCGSLDSTNRLGREVIAPSIQTAYSLTNARTVSTVVSTDDSEVYIEDDETAKISNATTPVVVMTDALPPKHPTGPSSKILLVPMVGAAKLPKSQRRRKKKKRKKTVATIVRANSRENISEMETITEGEEETSGDNNDLQDGSDNDDDDDEGSWCSTSDSDPGSRDPSPARSSRDPSPARSTGSATDRTMTPKVAAAITTTTTTTGPSPDRTTGTDQPKSKKKIPPVNV